MDPPLSLIYPAQERRDHCMDLVGFSGQQHLGGLYANIQQSYLFSILHILNLVCRRFERLGFRVQLRLMYHIGCFVSWTLHCLPIFRGVKSPENTLVVANEKYITVFHQFLSTYLHVESYQFVVLI